MKVIFLGSGNLATRLSLEMHRKGMTIGQVYSYTPENARQLAGRLGCLWTTDLEAIETDADLYVFSLKDTVLANIFSGHTANYGVLYPMQTFSKMREVDFSVIPFFIEANTSESASKLQQLAEKLSGNVRFLSSDKRKNLHLAAVFACNFTNHIYALAVKLLEQQDIPADVLLPLIDETVAKIHTMPPRVAQTGPAIRYDENVINKHLAMLGDSDMRSIYRLISQSIHKEARHE